MMQIENPGLENLRESGLSTPLLTACFQASRDGLVLVDSTGHIIAANQGFASLLGYDASLYLRDKLAWFIQDRSTHSGRRHAGRSGGRSQDF